MNSPIYQELTAKREELQKIFKDSEVKGADGAIAHNLDADQLVDVNKRNEDLNALEDRWQTERNTSSIRENNERALAESRRPANAHRYPEPDGARQAEQKEIKTLGQLFCENKEYTGRKGLALKGFGLDLDSFNPYDPQATLMTTTAGYAPFVPRISRVEMYPNRRPVVADLIPSIPTNDSAIKYMEETTFTNAAAGTAEGSALGESALAYTERTVPIEDVGTWIPATMQQLEDVPGMQSLIDNRLTYMLALKEEDGLVNDNGSSPNLQGFLNKSGVQSQAKGSDPVPDAILKGMTLVRGVTAGAGFAEPTGVILHPTDWQNIRLLRTSQGLYIWGDPSEAGPERIWGKPVIATPVIAQGTALLGDFQMYAAIYRKLGIRIDITDSHDVYFISNKFAIKIQERIALTIFRPSAFCKVTGLPA